MNSNILFWIIISLCVITAAQDYYFSCGGSSPSLCLAVCECIFCTKNETLADGLNNGTIGPDELSGSKNSGQGTCVTSREECPSKYYKVSGRDFVKSQGKGCGTFMAFMVAGVATMLLIIGCIIACLCDRRRVIFSGTVQAIDIKDNTIYDNL